MSKPKIGIVVGSTRPTRFADKPTEWIAALAKSHTDLDFEVVDLRDYPLPFFEDAVSPAWGASQNPAVLTWQKKVGELDGFIFVTPEYNRGTTAVLKNALDHAYGDWNNKPAAFVGYGPVGSLRAIEQLRLNAIELQMAPIRTGVHILMPDYLAVVQQGKSLADLEHLNAGAHAMLDQLAWWTHALKAARVNDAQTAKAA